MRIIRDDFDNLVESFGASRRVATRLGALARKQLHVSETLLEFAIDDDGKPLSKLLLAKALLDDAAKLNEKQLAKLANKQDAAFFEENPIALREQDGVRVICLAEEAGDSEPEAPAQSGLAVLPEGRITSVIDKEEARKMLGSDEISHLKLDLVTSSDVGRRLEAVRKLYLTELPPDEKLKLFLTALRDREADVRAEAARALGGLGLEASLTENLAKAARGATDERVVAISNLARVLGKMDGAQRRLGVSLLIEFITSGEDKEVVLGSLGVLATQLAEMEGGAQLAPHLHKQLIELLQVRFNMYEDAARKVYGKLYDADRDALSAMLVASVEEVSQPELRFFVLSLITEHDLAAASAQAVIAQLIDGLTHGSELDRNFQACSGALNRLGEKAVPGLLKSLEPAGDAGRGRVIDLLGHMLRGSDAAEYPLKTATSSKIANALLGLYSDATPEVCTALLESGFFDHSSLTDEARTKAAELIIESMHEFRFERQIELVHAALERCGRFALEPLRLAMLESAYDVTRLSAAKLLPEIVERVPEVPKEQLLTLMASIRTITDAQETEFPDRGPLYIALGRIGAHANMPADSANELAQLMRDRLGHSSNVYDILEGLGYLAAGENLAKEERLEVGYHLLSVLKRGLPGMSGRMRKNEEGEDVLHFGRETTAYTDMIPRILDGLGRMIEAKATPDILFERIAEELVKLWTEITDYKRVWAPAATMTLARLLGRIALGQRCKPRMADDITDLLTRKLVLLPVMQVIGQLVLCGVDSERMDLIAQRVFNELAKRINEEPGPEPTERRQVLETMTAIAQRPKIGEREKDIEHARRVVIEALFDALRDRVFQARTMLEQLAASKVLSETMRTDITRRLKPAAKRG
ncbi:MAG: HEAT repeat domain-containing protein [Planctomycetes bacterium]|nr:HEAT repeat domain-containing protein [Planctomycetota bacterium]